MIEVNEQHTATVHIVYKFSEKQSQLTFYNADIAQELAEDMQYISGCVSWIEYLIPVVR